MRINIKVVPRASKDEVVGRFGDGLKVRVKAPPEKGKANASVIHLIAAYYAVPETHVHMITGATSSRKCLDILDPKTRI